MTQPLGFNDRPPIREAMRQYLAYLKAKGRTFDEVEGSRWLQAVNAELVAAGFAPMALKRPVEPRSPGEPTEDVSEPDPAA